MIKCRSLSEESSLNSLLNGGSARLNLSAKDSFRDSRRNKLLLYAAIGGGARDFLGCSTGKYALVKFMDFFSNRVFSPVLISRVPELRGMKSESSDGILVKSNHPVLFSTDSTSKFGFHKTTKLKGIARA